ncbi:MAG TPA: hypothetical protein VFB80_04005 [Pirellulaceae bacterium]|nr:hypothetical protein [Pirellulaceae bacterium]
MKPLPTHFLFRSALACCAVSLACSATSAGEPLYTVAPLAEFPAPPASDLAVAVGPAEPFSPPPIPPWPGADLWEDYHRPIAGRGLYGPPCKTCRGHQQPLVSLLEGFLSLLTFPSRKAAAHRHGHSKALADCGCQPPATPPADWNPDQPPRNVIPRPVPPPEGEGEKPSAEPQRLYPGRAPVVELAPDPVLPPSSVQPPQNEIPTPGDRPPRNVIPRRPNRP